MKSKANYSRRSRLWKKIATFSYYRMNWLYRKALLVEPFQIKKRFSHKAIIRKKKISEIWKGIRVNNLWFEFYNGIEREIIGGYDARYIPLDIQYCYIDDWFNDSHAATVLDDKNMYDLYFYDINRPKTIGRVIDGSFFDESYCRIALNELLDKCTTNRQVILKPAVSSAAGAGIEFWSVDDGKPALEEFLKRHKNYIIQDLIQQHDDINNIYKDSVNSIRIVTCCLDGKTEILSSVIRMGVNGCRIDNASKGGLFCGINDDGSLKKYGYSKSGEAYVSHPQGAVFAECRIPNYSKCKELCVNLSNRFIRVAKLVSWDLAVDKNAEPILIEVNLCYGGADIHQIANGPLFKDYTENIIQRVFHQKKYKLYNLLND